MTASLILLFTFIFALLAVASAIGFVLQHRHGDGPQKDMFENLNERIQSWWIMIGVLCVAFLIGPVGVVVLFALCSFAALREFITLTHTQNADHWSLAAAFFIILPLQYISVAQNWYGFYAIFIPVYGFLFMSVLSALRGSTDQFLIRIAEAQWGLMVSVFCVSHVPALIYLNIPGYEGKTIFLIMFLLLVVQLSDVLQYVFGKIFGRRKIAPTLSPSKTVEGLVGGTLSASLIGAMMYWITPFSFAQAFGMSLIITLMGFLGGLVMSAIKRDRGIKDWGYAISGHGGFIDRLDSVIFSAPIFFHITRFFWDIH